MRPTTTWRFDRGRRKLLRHAGVAAASAALAIEERFMRWLAS